MARNGLMLCVVMALTAPLALSRTARTVLMSDQDIVTVYAKYRYSTVIVLPRGEQIEDISSGDASSKASSPEFWRVDGEPGSNICYVRPIRRNVSTDLQIMTKNGHSYSFLLHEVSKEKGLPDLKVFVKRRNLDPPSPKPEVSACDVNLKHQLFETKNMLDAEKQAFGQQVSELRGQIDRLVNPSSFLASIQQDYHIPRKLRHDPFDVSAIWHNGTTTFIKSAAQERAAFYEKKDGKEDFVNYRYENGIYTIPGIVDVGVLKLGKKQAEFHRKAS